MPFKTFIGAKPLFIIYYKADGVVKDGEAKYIVLFSYGKYDAI